MKHPPSIYWIGDSTVHFNRIDTYPVCGMGQALPLYVKPGVAVHVHGENGCSTKSFWDRGFFAPVLEELEAGDILLIQFGHNDPKDFDPERYAAPEQYRANLLRYARLAQGKGALPVLVTPLTRRRFDGDVLTHSHGVYPQVVRDLAHSEGIPLIDLTAASRKLVEALGDKGTRELYMMFPAGVYKNYPDGAQDETHLRYPGAVVFTGMVAQGLRALGQPYADLLVEDDGTELERAKRDSVD